MKLGSVFLCLGFLLSSVLLLEGRTWTRAKDKKQIEAEMVKLEGEMIVLSMRGKEYRIPLSQFIEADQEYAREKAEEAPEKKPTAEAQSLFGVALEPGKTAKMETELSKSTAKALKGNKLKPTKMKIEIRLPADFDPSQPQKVFWAVGGINNEQERLSGNIGVIGRMAVESLKAGWVVVAADTEHGNPRESTVKVCKGDPQFQAEVVEHLTGVWPEFKNWSHACGGFSSGAKGSYFRVAHLRKAGCKVVGIFLGGCNQSMGQFAMEEARVRKSAAKGVKAWFSYGTKDSLVSKKNEDTVKSESKSAGYRKFKVDTYDAGHSMSNESFAKALAWFAEEE